MEVPKLIIIEILLRKFLVDITKDHFRGINCERQQIAKMFFLNPSARLNA